ncbi:hypothetical protein BJ170DRAFT_622715 [Xylariales sp. AK1849]|nr:hypothetical protein BJ170DRAFT_622715 [Xylariales sp. AK1849]
MIVSLSSDLTFITTSFPQIQTMAQTPLPQDIILLLCQQLALRRDFPTLFRCSLVSRRVASIALEQLYSIHEMSPVSMSETTNSKEWARIWKSVIRSAKGCTAYPYCTYIQSLSLSSYESLLEDVYDDKIVRPWLFNAEEGMEQFLVLRSGQPLKRPTRKQTMPLIDLRNTMLKAGEAITSRIKDMADQTETSTTVVHLEANTIPAEILPSWLTRLGSLTSLQLSDGSVLTAEAASAIYEYCPRFSELKCFLCQGDNADENMAAFLQTLMPNTLQSFQILSYNDISERALAALNMHGGSLKALRLGSLSSHATKCLNVLPNCVALETLNIENRKHDQIDLTTCGEGLIKEITAWIQNCKNLRDLTFTDVKDALLIVKDILNTPNIQLNSLSLEGFSSQSEEVSFATWAALGLHGSLEELTLGGQDGTPDGLVIHENPPLASSICKLQNLKVLRLIRAVVRTAELRQMVAALPGLTELKFGGEWADDQALESLSNLRGLKVLLINALSVFTYEALQSFALKLNHADHSGINVDIVNQMGGWKLSQECEAQLSEYFTNVLNGRIEIGYAQDPDELHESDFSVTSD